MKVFTFIFPLGLWEQSQLLPNFEIFSLMLLCKLYKTFQKVCCTQQLAFSRIWGIKQVELILHEGQIIRKKESNHRAVLVMWQLALCPIPISFESQGIERRQTVFPRFSRRRAYMKVLPMAHGRHWVGD